MEASVEVLSCHDAGHRPHDSQGHSGCHLSNSQTPARSRRAWAVFVQHEPILQTAADVKMGRIQRYNVADATKPRVDSGARASETLAIRSASSSTFRWYSTRRILMPNASASS